MVNLAQRTQRTYATAQNAQAVIDRFERDFGLEETQGVIAVQGNRFVPVVRVREHEVKWARPMAERGILVI